MATSPTRVLQFPVAVRPATPLESLFGPFPEEPSFDRLRRLNRLLSDPMIAAYRLQHDMLRLQRFAPYLSPAQTLLVQGAVEWLVVVLDEIERDVKATAERQAKAVGLIA